MQVDRADTMIRIRVMDTGHGIAVDDHPRLFQRFAQLAPAHGRTQEGTGLGLAIAAGVAELMGGTLELTTSTPGQGSVFTLLIPLVVPAAAGPGASA